jgi:hypothetical protein
MRGIQYAETSQFLIAASGILDHPLSRMMTSIQLDRFVAGACHRARIRATRWLLAMTAVS